jgi:OmpA-OmpF porin, OOP family
MGIDTNTKARCSRDSPSPRAKYASAAHPPMDEYALHQTFGSEHPPVQPVTEYISVCVVTSRTTIAHLPLRIALPVASMRPCIDADAFSALQVTLHTQGLPMASFLDEATSLLSPDLISKAASAFGVPADGIQKAMGAAMPTVLGAVAGKAGDSGFMGQLFEMATSSSNTGSPASSAMDLLGSIAGGGSSPMMDMGKKLVGGLFGASGDGIAGAIGKMAGVGSAGSGIMGTVGALALSMIGNRVRSGGLNVGSLANMLMGEKDSLMKAIPGPIGAMMGLAGIGGAAKAATGAAAGAAVGAARSAAAAAPAPSRSMLVPLLGLAAVAAAGYFFWNRSKAPAEMPAAVAVDTAAKPAAPTLPAGMQMMKLPNGTELQASTTGIESQLVAFIQDAAKPVDKTTWFDFDRLLFQTGSAKLEASSMDQLKNIAEIMKAFPAVKLKIGGYTDNVGKAASNMKLSDDRAKAAMAELVTMGVAADRLAAEGYGDTVPVADNTTEEGRAKNRRTAARVSAK